MCFRPLWIGCHVISKSCARDPAVKLGGYLVWRCAELGMVCPVHVQADWLVLPCLGLVGDSEIRFSFAKLERIEMKRFSGCSGVFREGCGRCRGHERYQREEKQMR